MRLVPVLALMLGCHGRMGGDRPQPAPGPPDPGPTVDETCLQHAREGRLVESQPSEAAGFVVTPAKGGVHMVRTGRPLTKDEGSKLWQTFSHEYFSRGGLSMGSSAMSSVYKCPDVGDASCLTLSLWVCQADIATIATRVADAAAQIGAPDGELAVNLDFVERPPSCTGAACGPKVHYSTKNGRYEQGGERHLSTRGRGRCTSDADCEGGGNGCSAWYLAGGAETAIYIQYGEPTFCGCVENTCNWFTQ